MASAEGPGMTAASWRAAPPAEREAYSRSLRRLRVRRGWRQQDVADRAGIAATTLANIETGHQHPRLVVALAVAAVLGTTVQAMVAEDDTDAEVSRVIALLEAS